MHGSLALKIEPHAESATSGGPESSSKPEISLDSVRPRPYRWILHPVADLLLSCGGLVWILFAFHWCIAAPTKNVLLLQTLAIVSILGTHGFGETHIAATLMKVFGSLSTRQKFHRQTTVWVAIFACLGLAGLFIPGVTPWMTRAYLILVAQHFTAQTYGLALLYCYKNQYTLDNVDKTVIRWLLNFTALYAVARQLTFKEWNANGFLAQQVPWFTLPGWIFNIIAVALVATGLLSIILIVKRAVTAGQLMPLPAILTIFTGIAMFVATRDQVGILFLYLPAFYHGSQYVVLTLATHLKEKGLPDGIPTTEIYRACSSPAALKYLGMLLLMACAIYIGLPRMLEEIGFAYTLSFATVFLVFNL
ncbi:MAG TPA: hypothetical protein V6C72_17735, partial [Chroococcales cyanobacterium]